MFIHRPHILVTKSSGDSMRFTQARPILCDIIIDIKGEHSLTAANMHARTLARSHTHINVHA